MTQQMIIQQMPDQSNSSWKYYTTPSNTILMYYFLINFNTITL